MKRLTWIAGALFVAIGLAWLWRDARVRHEAFRDFSMYNSSGKGLSIAGRYLESTGRTVKPMSRPLSRSFLPPDAVLLRIRPEAAAERFDPEGGSKSVPLRPMHASDQTDPVRYAFTAEEEEWIRGGGRLVLAIDRPYGSLDVGQSGAQSTRKVFPLWPGVATLDPPTVRVLRGGTAREGVSIFATDDGPVVTRHRRGSGEIILCSAPEIFQNGALGRADHLALLDRVAGSGRTVYFDEHVHGIESGAGMVEILRQWGFGPFLGLLALVALVAFWRRRVRVGPEEDDARETRTEAVDFVDSLATLYRRMLPRRHALMLYAKAFEKAVAVQTGLRDAALQARIEQYLPRRERPRKGKDYPETYFAQELENINVAFRRLNDAKRSGSGRPPAAGARSA